MDANDVKKVSKAVIFNKKGQILILLPKNKEKWHLPGGHLQQYESFLTGMKREVKEETGLTITVFILTNAKPDFQLWLCQSNNIPVKLSNEHTKFKWVAIDKVLKQYNITKETRRDIEHTIKVAPKYRNWFPMLPRIKPEKKPIKKVVEEEEEEDKSKYGKISTTNTSRQHHRSIDSSDV